MTTAEEIAKALDNDGTAYETDGGDTLDSLSDAAGAVTRGWIDGSPATRYEYPDGSAIVDTGSAWDLALDPTPGSRCLCWAGPGEHEADCPDAAEPGR